MRKILNAIALCLAFGFANFAANAQDATAGPIGSQVGPFRDQLHWVPFPAGPAERTGLLSMRVCRPPGDGPHKLAIINHGSPPRPDQRPTMEPSGCDREATRWFLDRGFAVAFPLRRGYGRTGGAWAENYGACATPDYFRAGLQTANDIEAAIAYARELPFVRKDAIIVVGQSAGGWGTLALSSRNPDGVAAMVNFAGGRGGWRDNRPNNNCAPSELAVAAGRYGASARQPILWVYTQNDTFFAPEISREMHAAYARSGGNARFELLGAFGNDGHGLFFGQGGARVWGPIVDAYLAERGVR
jgi:dienelactone hydrolase